MNEDIPSDPGVPYGEPEPGEKIPEPPKPSRKEQAKEQLKDAAEDQVKKAASQVIKQAARAAARAIAQAAASAAAAFVAAIGWPAFAACLAIFIIIAVFCFGLIIIGYSGVMGKTNPKPAGKNDPNIAKIIQLASTPSRVADYNKIVFSFEDDRDYVKDGKIDYRLAKALVYLSGKHEMINVSEIIHDYQYMDTSEAGTDTNPQIIKNISAHKDGLAADINQIDFVYKVFQENKDCSVASNGLAGDIVYYNDLNEELFRLKCQGTLFDVAKTNTTWHNQTAEGIPIKILYQDCKPPIEHAGNQPDPCTTITDPIEQEVFQKVFQLEARRKTHLTIAELLQFPYDAGDVNQYKVTQLITYSYERDVQPFEKDGTLDKLYGLPRPANYGLFALKEAWQNIHIGY